MVDPHREGLHGVVGPHEPEPQVADLALVAVGHDVPRERGLGATGQLVDELPGAGGGQDGQARDAQQEPEGVPQHRQLAAVVGVLVADHHRAEVGERDVALDPRQGAGPGVDPQRGCVSDDTR